MYQNGYKSRAANKSSTVLYYIAVKVVLISSQQRRRSGRKCMHFWAANFQGLHNRLSKPMLTWCLFFCGNSWRKYSPSLEVPSPVSREREGKVCLRVLKKKQRMLWSNCRDFWDSCDARDVPETQECLPSAPGLPCPWNGASSQRAIRKV